MANRPAHWLQALYILLPVGFMLYLAWKALPPERVAPGTLPAAPAGASGSGVPAGSGEMLGRFPRSRFYLERDRFLPATDPAVIPAERAGFLAAKDEVFGVEVGGHARAYPVPMIAYHHVVNDVIQGIPVAVTY